MQGGPRGLAGARPAAVPFYAGGIRGQSEKSQRQLPNPVLLRGRRHSFKDARQP
jgi:hypothetical protein